MPFTLVGLTRYNRLAGATPFKWLPWLPVEHGFVGHYRDKNDKLEEPLGRAPSAECVRVWRVRKAPCYGHDDGSG